MSVKVSANASVDSSANIGDGTTIWGDAQVRSGVIIGHNCIIGNGVYIDTDVEIGNNCKIQNMAQVYHPAKLANGVFLGPGAVLTNDQYPRSVNPDGTLKSTNDWSAVGVTINEGASIGARAVCVAPLKIGAWALIAAGAVVTKDVPDFALMVGVPAKRIGWVGRAGLPLEAISDGRFRCPITENTYIEEASNRLIEESNK
jgi:UDP-2-acetamido-3-amino-2,3-dideoxy-glucuronate N-acetyltransferase